MVDPGDTIAGRYELLERLGSGGMAEVLRARDGRLDREVAVKVLSAHRADDPTIRRYFRREARAAATLNHPNAVAVYDTGEHGDVQYIVMELVDGPTLQEVIRDESPLPVGRALAVAIGVTEALAAAHAAGLVHRDIKPGNIMFADDGEVKVADFGLARAVAATTRTAEVYGSAPYMSPEQARGQHVDARTDLYSLGCVLHEMLTGDPPFTGDTAIQVVSQHLHAEPPSLAEARSDVPSGLDDVVRRALAKDPGHRFADAGSLADALRAVRDARPVDAALPATRRLDREAETVAVGAGSGAAARDTADTGGAGAPRATTGDGGDRAAAGDTGVADGRAGTSRRARRGLALAVVAAVAVLALIALASLEPGAETPLLGDDPDTEEPADDEAPAPADEDPPPAEDELPPEGDDPPPDGDGIDGVRDAADDALELLDEGVREGGVTEDARDDIASYVRDAVDEAEDGDWEDAGDDARVAREKVREHREDGAIEEDWERPLDHALRDLEHAIRDATPRGGD